MKWIKANERLPEILERNYIVRQKGNSRSAHAVWWAHVHGNVEGYLKLALYDIEWLDESESPTTADASVLVEALQKTHDLFERFMPKEVATDNRKEMAMYEAFHTIKNAISQYNALPGSQGGEEQSIIDKCETAVEVLRTMLKKLKMPIGVDAADSILKQIKGYKIMNQKEDTGPQSMPLPVQEPLQSTQSPSSIEESGLKEGEERVKADTWFKSLTVNERQHLRWIYGTPGGGFLSNKQIVALYRLSPNH